MHAAQYGCTPVLTQTILKHTWETMRYQDAIYLTQEVARTCRISGLLQHVWGSNSLSFDGVIDPRVIPSEWAKPDAPDKYAATHLYTLFARAEPYYVDSHLLSAIEVSAPSLPDHTRLNASLFPSKNGCLWFDRPVKGMPDRLLHAVAGLPRHEPAPMSGFAWQTDERGVILTFLYSWAVDKTSPSRMAGVYIGNIPLSVAPWDFGVHKLGDWIKANDGKIIDHDRTNAVRLAMSTRICVATLLLMDQTIVQRTRLGVDRATRRQAERSGWKHDPSVHVVTLRRVEHKRYEDSQPRDWAFRWVCREHWRTLHRGTHQERTVLVHSYIKGPPDKPLRMPANRVWAVTR